MADLYGMLSKLAILLFSISLTSCLIKTKISNQNYNTVDPGLLDSLKCNLEETSSMGFENSLKQRLAKNSGYPSLPGDSNGNSITYLKYDEPRAIFLMISVMTDSLYHFSSFKVRQNFFYEGKFKEISRKYLGALKEIDYSVFFSDTTFYLDYCYVTERVDKIIFLKRNNIFVGGVVTPDWEGMNLPRQKYGSFDKLGDGLYQRLRFR